MFKILTLALLVYALIHTFVTLYVAKHFKKYNPEKLSISRLGTRKSPKNLIFNVSSFVFGVLVTFFGLQLSFISVYATVIVTLIGLFLTFSSMFAYDKFPKIHDTIAGILGFLCVIFSLFFVNYVLAVSWLPKFLIFVAIGITICAGMLVFELSHKTRKLSYPKYTWYWEWGIFTLEMLFIISTCFSIVNR